MNKWIKAITFFFLLFIPLLLIVKHYSCPLFNEFPQPTGNYSVGMQRFAWTAPNQKDDRAQFMVDLFYPSSDQSQKSPYQPKKMAAYTAILPQETHLPRIAWHCLLANIFSYAQQNAPLAHNHDRFPVILYLPGINSVDLHNLYLEELASHGYILCAIEPPRDIMLSVLPNDRIITADSALKKATAHNDREAIYRYRNEAHIRWIDYINAALQELTSLNQQSDSPFYQRLDLTNLGLIGHSHGGAVVTDFCMKDARCKAGINMDGWTKTYNRTDRFQTPFLFLLSETGEMPEMLPLFANNQRPDFEKVIIKNANHGSFTDDILAKRLPSLLIGGGTKNSPEKVRQEISKRIVDFFDRYLKKSE